MERYDVAVVGAGIVGTSTALQLRMRGKKVVLIDRREPGRETSYGNAGIMETARVLPYGFPPLDHWPRILLNQDTQAILGYAALPSILPWLVKYYFETLPTQRRAHGKELWPLISHAEEEHRQQMRGTGAEIYWKTSGRVYLYRTEKDFEQDALERQVATEMGIPFQIMDAKTFREVEPDIKPVFAKTVIWKSTTRFTDPGAIVAAYAEHFVREGGTLMKADARHLDTDGKNWRIETIQGGISADQVVVCTGPWATDILKPLGYRFPMAFKRGYHQHFAADSNSGLSHSINDVANGFSFARMEKGYRLMTAAEFTDRDAPPNPIQITRALPLARELFPLTEPVEPTPWMGSRPCFSDSLPVIGKAARHAGLWFNIGHSHVGMTIGPSSGRLLAEIMLGSTTFCDPAPYRPGRFGC